MIYRFLKAGRVTISLVFLLVLTYSLLDFARNLSTGIINSFTYLQFIPSFLKFVTLLGLSATGFAFVLLITFFFGRVYCSTVCPLGILQDVFAWISRKFKIRRKVYRFSKPFNWLRYTFLGIAIVSFILGTSLALNLLDPFSNFGKIISDLGRPAYVFINNKAAHLLESQKILLLAPKDLKEINPLTLIFPSLFLGLILWLSFTMARLYCNTICPVGTFLGLAARLSLFKIRIDKETCNRCGKCSVTCKSFCIDIKEWSVDFSRCVGCFNCLKVCPSSSILYKNSLMPSIGSRNAVDEDKRSFFAQTLALLLSLSAFSSVSRAGEEIPKSKKPTTVKEKKNYPVSPPGSISIEHFNQTCTACHLCVTACPVNVLKPSVLEYGLIGFIQPRMDYNVAYCTYECIACTKVCPTGALLPLTVDKKKTNQMGKVVFVKENCIPYVENTACGSCSEHCPTQAVKMVTFNRGSLTMPQTDTEVCIGCGACEEACPTRPYKAIYVDGNPVHKLAKKPKQEKIKEEVKEDFAF